MNLIYVTHMSYCNHLIVIGPFFAFSDRFRIPRTKSSCCCCGGGGRPLQPALEQSKAAAGLTLLVVVFTKTIEL